jgi:L-2-hydroxyglutarate oxidase LhgO
MWSLANHPRIPENIRKEVSRWGTCRDEYEREDGWQQQLYIREARRMVGDYVMTQKNCEGMEVVTDDGTHLLARTVVNAAGLNACSLAHRILGMDTRHVPKPWFAKGSYFVLSGRSPFEHLIYPAPEPDKHLAGLGVHLTLDLGGQAKFGPDVEWTEDPDNLLVDPARGAAFYAEVRRYWPALPDGALQAGYAGIRPKISGPQDPAADF